MNVGGPEIMIVLVVLLGVLPQLAVIIDVARLPESAFVATGTSRTLWIVLPVIGLVACAVGWVVVLIWVIAIRPKVVAAARPQ